MNENEQATASANAVAAVDEALRLWNDGRGMYDEAWVARQAKNMAQTLRQARAALLITGDAS